MRNKCLVLPLMAGAALFLTQSVSYAKEYKIDEGHTTVGFEVRHMFTDLGGTFKKFEGEFSFDAAKPEASKVTAEVAVSSVDTNESKRDKHLLSPDFFDEKKFPKLTFVSKKFTPNGDKKYKMDGDLTMHGVTKPVTFDVTFTGEGDDAWGSHRSGFKATTQINRKDFGIKWNKALDKGGFVVGDDVTINLKIEGIEKKAEATEKKSESKEKK